MSQVSSSNQLTLLESIAIDNTSVERKCPHKMPRLHTYIQLKLLNEIISFMYKRDNRMSSVLTKDLFLKLKLLAELYVSRLGQPFFAFTVPFRNKTAVFI